MGWGCARGQCLVLLWAVRAVVAGPGGAWLPSLAVPHELPIDLEEPGDQLVIDEASGGLAYVKVRSSPAEAEPFFWAIGDAPPPSPQASQSASSWEPCPGSSGAPAPTTAPAGEAADAHRPRQPPPAPLASPSPAPAPAEQPPAEGAPEVKFWYTLCRSREGWAPHGPLAVEAQFQCNDRKEQLEEELKQYPIKAWYREDRAKKAAAYSGEHYWRSSRGGVEGEGGCSKHTAGLALPERLAWTWRHKLDKWATILDGVSIDDRLNIYLTSFDAVRKFDLTGRMLWEHMWLPSQCTDSPCLYKGGLYGCVTTGELYAMDIEDGHLIWLTKVSYQCSQDNGFVQVGEDVVVVSVHADLTKDSGELSVLGVAAADGTVLWIFVPDDPVWNFGAGFPNDGTTLFQDLCGKGYRLSLKDGSLIWKTGGCEKSWTDGTSTLGPDNVFYTVFNVVSPGYGTGLAPGRLVANRVEDGSTIWEVVTVGPPNNAPAIGPLKPGGPNAVVMPCGGQCYPDNPTFIYIYDAKDGSLLYSFIGPKLQRREPFMNTFQAADPQGIKMRLHCGIRDQSAPNPWGAPSIGGDGTIYCGNQDGQFYCLRVTDKPAVNSFRYNGNWHGVVCAGKDKALEVWAFDCFACFGGPAGAAIAPGVLVVGSIDTMFVFLDPSIQGKAAEAKPAASPQ